MQPKETENIKELKLHGEQRDKVQHTSNQSSGRKRETMEKRPIFERIIADNFPELLNDSRSQS